MELYLTHRDIPELNLPYFGRQSSFVGFFEKILDLYGVQRYAETNSGSCSNAFYFAKNREVIVNDLGYYSNLIARSVFNGGDDESMKLTAKIASMIRLQGYNPTTHDFLEDDYLEYLKHLREQAGKGRSAKVFNLDLMDYLVSDSLPFCDAIFMDFAWPWRDGSPTEEYETTVDGIREVITGEKRNFSALTRHNIIPFVLEAVRRGKKKGKYVFLSNQSSNFPDPETLEISLLLDGWNYERHTVTITAENEDNLGKEKYFREYLYVI